MMMLTANECGPMMMMMMTMTPMRDDGDCDDERFHAGSRRFMHSQNMMGFLFVVLVVVVLVVR